MRTHQVEIDAMTADEAKALKKGERVVARYPHLSDQSGQVVSHEGIDLVIKWDTPPGLTSRAPHEAWQHLRREEKQG